MFLSFQVLQHFCVSDQWQLYATPNPRCILSFIQFHRCTEGVQQDQRNRSMAQHMMVEKPLVDWNVGLFDCFEEVNTCCYGFWCGPCLACTVSRNFGENNCLPLCDVFTSALSGILGIPACVPPAALSVRAAMRNRYGIKGSLCRDIAVSCFCTLCSWCQMHRELKHRKKTLTVINIQNNPVINMQPIPAAQTPVIMVSGQLVPAGFVAQPGVVSNISVSVVEVQHTMEVMPLTNWNTGLFDCFEDARTCCYGFWCCPCLACSVSERFGENRCLPLCDIFGPGLFAACGIPACVPPAVLSARAAMRNRYGIKGSLCRDIAVSCFCEWCSWCQMHRELKHRKKNPTVINIQNNPVVHMQPIPTAQPPVMMMPGQPVAPGYVVQPGVVMHSY